MGIKGTVRRSTDGDFIHANVDLDVIITEEPPQGSLDKPEEIFHIMEHFCLGRRRLHVFGEDHTVRPGQRLFEKRTMLVLDMFFSSFLGFLQIKKQIQVRGMKLKNVLQSLSNRFIKKCAASPCSDSKKKEENARLKWELSFSQTCGPD